MSVDTSAGQAASPSEREANIRRKLARTASVLRTRILLLAPDVRERRRAELDGYLVALAAWEAGEGDWPTTPEHIFAASRYAKARR